MPVPNMSALNMLLCHIKKSNWYTIKETKAESYINACTKHACIEYVIISHKKIKLIRNKVTKAESSITSKPVPNMLALNMLLFHIKKSN